MSRRRKLVILNLSTINENFNAKNELYVFLIYRADCTGMFQEDTYIIVEFPHLILPICFCEFFEIDDTLILYEYLPKILMHLILFEL